MDVQTQLPLEFQVDMTLHNILWSRRRNYTATSLNSEGEKHQFSCKGKNIRIIPSLSTANHKASNARNFKS